MKKVRLGAGTGWARDRFTHTADLIANGNIDYLCFETMSEITMSATQVKNFGKADARRFDPYLEARLAPILKDCQAKGITIISNQGWMDPQGAARRLAEVAREQGLSGLKIAAVYNSKDIEQAVRERDIEFPGTGKRLSTLGNEVISAEVYFGADGIVEALKNGADVVLTTRIVDSALYLGPLAYEFGWDMDDPRLAAKGSTIGHLLECGVQATGGYYGDPGYKPVPDPARVGVPIVEVTEEYVHITKTPTSGGLVTPDTLIEQMLYEITDPKEYILPNVIVDFTDIKFEQVAKDVVAVTGFKGRQKPEKLKVLVGFKEGFMTEEYVIWAGPGALSRAELAKDILRERFEIIGFKPKEFRWDYVGRDACLREATPDYAKQPEPWEVVLRLAAKDDSQEMCQLLGKEIDTICMCGAASTGKYGPMSNRTRPVIGMLSGLIDRDAVAETVGYYEV